MVLDYYYMAWSTMQYKPSDLDIQSAFSPMKDETRERTKKVYELVSNYRVVWRETSKF